MLATGYQNASGIRDSTRIHQDDLADERVESGMAGTTHAACYEKVVPSV